MNVSFYVHKNDMDAIDIACFKAVDMYPAKFSNYLHDHYDIECYSTIDGIPELMRTSYRLITITYKEMLSIGSILKFLI